MKYVVLIAWVGILWVFVWLFCFLWHLNWRKGEEAFCKISDFLEEHLLP